MNLAEVIEAGVAAGTLILAGFTWRLARATNQMAVATQQMAVGAEEQLELLRRQTEAAEAATEQDKLRTLDQSSPYLNINRGSGEEADCWISHQGPRNNAFGIALVNDGLVTANVTDARVRLDGTSEEIHLAQTQRGGIPAREVRELSSEEVSGLGLQHLCDGRQLHLSVNYRGSKGSTKNMQATLQAKKTGEESVRFLIVTREAHK